MVQLNFFLYRFYHTSIDNYIIFVEDREVDELINEIIELKKYLNVNTAFFSNVKQISFGDWKMNVEVFLSDDYLKIIVLTVNNLLVLDNIQTILTRIYFIMRRSIIHGLKRITRKLKKEVILKV